MERESRLEVGRRLEPKDQLRYLCHRVLTADKSQEKDYGEKAELRLGDSASAEESTILPGWARGLWRQQVFSSEREALTAPYSALLNSS